MNPIGYPPRKLLSVMLVQTSANYINRPSIRSTRRHPLSQVSVLKDHRLRRHLEDLPPLSEHQPIRQHSENRLASVHLRSVTQVLPRLLEDLHLASLHSTSRLRLVGPAKAHRLLHNHLRLDRPHHPTLRLAKRLRAFQHLARHPNLPPPSDKLLKMHHQHLPLRLNLLLLLDSYLNQPRLLDNLRLARQQHLKPL